MNRETWYQRLVVMEAELGLHDGFRFVYGPWATLKTGRIAFLSLNPGRAPSGSVSRDVSDERGNSYAVEKHTTLSPITDQALRAFSAVGAQPYEVLTGVVCPFRTLSWNDLTREKRDRALALGCEFWVQPLQRPGLELIICCATETTQAVVGWLNAR